MADTPTTMAELRERISSSYAALEHTIEQLSDEQLTAPIDGSWSAKDLLAQRIDQIWPEEGAAVSLTALSSGAGINLVQRDLFELSPRTERQQWLRSNALESTNTIAQSRWTTIEQIESRFPWAFFVVVVSWLAVIFASFGLFAPRNASVIAALLVAAIALAGPIFMMLEMDQPYGGLVKIPSTSLRVALDQLGKA